MPKRLLFRAVVDRARSDWTDLCQVVSEIVKAQFAVGDIRDVTIVGRTPVSFLASDITYITRGNIVRWGNAPRKGRGGVSITRGMQRGPSHSPVWGS